MKTSNYLSFIAESQLAYLKGNIYEEGQNKIKIIVSIRPNIFCGISFFLFLVLGTAGIYQYIFDRDMSEALFWGLLMFMVAIPVTIGLARVFTLSFLDKFEIYLNIKPVVK